MKHWPARAMGHLVGSSVDPRRLATLCARGERSTGFADRKNLAKVPEAVTCPICIAILAQRTRAVLA